MTKVVQEEHPLD